MKIIIPVCQRVKYLKSTEFLALVYADTDRGMGNPLEIKRFLMRTGEENMVINGFDNVMDSRFFTEVDKSNPRVEVVIEELE